MVLRRPGGVQVSANGPAEAGDAVTEQKGLAVEDGAAELPDHEEGDATGNVQDLCDLLALKTPGKANDAQTAACTSALTAAKRGFCKWPNKHALALVLPACRECPAYPHAKLRGAAMMGLRFATPIVPANRWRRAAWR